MGLRKVTYCSQYQMYSLMFIRHIWYNIVLYVNVGIISIARIYILITWHEQIFSETSGCQYTSPLLMYDIRMYLSTTLLSVLHLLLSSSISCRYILRTCNVQRMYYSISMYFQCNSQEEPHYNASKRFNFVLFSW